MNSTRRSFLLATGLAAAQAAIPALSSPVSNTNSRLRIGFLGATHSHASGKIRVVQRSKQWLLAGIWDESAEVRAKLIADGLPVAESLEALFKETDAVAVESAVRDHARHAELALVAGKHVHLEKPPAVNLPALDNLLRLAAEKHLLLQLGYMWRYHPGINTALDAARRGYLGQVFLIRAAMHTWVDAERRPEWAEFKGGGLFELGCHLLDPIVRLMGKPLAVRPFLRHHGPFPGDNLRDNNVVVLEFPSALAILTNSTLQPNAMAHRAFEILGTHGTATVRPLENPVLQLDLARAAGPYTAGLQTLPLPRYERYVDDFEDLAEAIRSKRRLTVSAEEDRLVQETLLHASEMI